MTTMADPIGGGLVDWAYSAGWDTGDQAAFNLCKPMTLPKVDKSFMAPTVENVRAAVYHVGTDTEKNPSYYTYGSRDKIEREEGDYQVTRQSIENGYPEEGFDGHINRNIRLATALIDMSKPYIYIRHIGKDAADLDFLQVEFTVNGCAQAEYVGAIVNFKY